jgi:hypothetical protein
VTVSVGQRPITTPEGAAAQLKQAAAQGNVLLLLNRYGMSQFVGLSVENNGTAAAAKWPAPRRGKKGGSPLQETRP